MDPWVIQPRERMRYQEQFDSLELSRENRQKDSFLDLNFSLLFLDRYGKDAV